MSLAKRKLIFSEDAMNPYSGMKGLKLNLGCGDKLMPDYINIDTLDKEGVANIDLEDAKLPFDDESVSLVNASQCFEHIRNFIPLMNEIYRVLENGGTLTMDVPNAAFLEAFQDPTHVRFFTENTMQYWLKGAFLYEDVGKNYGIKPFSWMLQTKNGWILRTVLKK